MEKAKKRVTLQNLRDQENEKENQSEDFSQGNECNQKANSEEESGWFGGLGSLYSWCQSGLVQVSTKILDLFLKNNIHEIYTSMSWA